MIPLNARQDGRHIVRGTPAVLKNIKAEFTGTIDIRMKHLANELDTGGFIRVLFLEIHDQAKGAILKRRISRSDNNGIPGHLSED